MNGRRKECKVGKTKQISEKQIKGAKDYKQGQEAGEKRNEEMNE